MDKLFYMLVFLAVSVAGSTLLLYATLGMNCMVTKTFYSENPVSLIDCT